jgi:hypothetical protein
VKKRKKTAEERRAEQARYDETTRLLLERLERVGTDAQPEKRRESS